MSSLADFNRILKAAILEAQVIEKNDPARAIANLLKIAEYALEFAKRQADFTLRRKIEQKIKGIIDHIQNVKAKNQTLTAEFPEDGAAESKILAAFHLTDEDEEKK